MKLSYMQDVEYECSKHEHLIPVFTSLYGIPERVHDYDPDLYVALNVSRQVDFAKGRKPNPPPAGIIPKWGAWYEIRSLKHGLVMSNPFGELDVRILRKIWKGDLRMRGRRVFEEIDEHNERLERRRQRDWQNKNEALAHEIARPFQRIGWGKSLFGVS